MAFAWLNLHVGYGCRHSGACCASGWPIPVEGDRAADIQAIVDRGGTAGRGRAWLVAADGAPADVAGALALNRDGHCVFHGTTGCAVYPARPTSCAHFPYVCLIDARGVRVTLSHYCPTAASMLFEHEGPVAIVEGPSPVPGVDPPEGLDARESLPPLRQPGRLMSFDEFSSWEREQVARVDSSFPGFDDLHLFDHARASVPAPHTWPGRPGELERTWRALVQPDIAPFAPVIQRYLAARLFGSWAAYLGDGTNAVLQSVRVAKAVLQVEIIRACGRAARRLDAALLKEAIRQSDLLLVHYADPRVLSSGTAP
ncbi:MAG: hypothetical protein WC815_16215 [Vicinamibacterales bacterium]